VLFRSWNHSETSRAAKSVDYWTGDNDPVNFTHNSEPWKIVVHYKRGGGTQERPISFTTDVAGQNLSILSDDKLRLFAFRRYSQSLMEHPKKYNIDSIEFVTGTDRVAAHGCSVRTVGTISTLVCPCASNSDCGILIHYCASTASGPGCM